MSAPAIETRGLTKFYGETRGIEELDLRVARGEIFGYLGPNGAGKTTTIRLLLDLIRPTRGRAEIAGLDTQAQSVEVRRRTGYLPGELKPPLRSSAIGFLSYLGRLRGGVDRRVIGELAERLELPLGRRMGELSKGNKQKVGVIAAFMHDPFVSFRPTRAAGPSAGQAMPRVEGGEGQTCLWRQQNWRPRFLVLHLNHNSDQRLPRCLGGADARRFRWLGRR